MSPISSPITTPLSILRRPATDLPTANVELASELARLQREEQVARDRERERELALVRERAKFD